ncbi:MAG: hypothetical protein AAFO02_26220, partial [Bacteroidota bacterium]
MNLFPRLRFALFFLTFISLSQFAAAQQTEDWAGDWDGTLKVPGMELAMHIELTSTDAGWVGTLDIPQQMIKGMALSD